MRYLLALLAIVGVTPTATPGDTSWLIMRLGTDRFRQAQRVDAITYSPDGKQLATTDGESIHIWDAADGRRLRTVSVKEREVLALRYAEEGRVLVVATCESRYRSHLLRLDSGEGKLLTDVVFPPPRSKDNYSPLPEAVFSPDGALLALREDDGRRLMVADVKSGKSAFSNRYEDDRPYSLAFRPDGRVLAVGDFVGRVRLLDSKSGRLLQEHTFDTAAVWKLDFSPDGKALVAYFSHSGPARVTLFNAETGKVQWNHKTDGADHLRFTPDGREIVFYKRVWHRLDSTTGKPVGKPMDTKYGREVAIRLDGKALAVGGFHGQISQWDLSTRKRLDRASADPPGPVNDLSFNKEGTTIRGWARGWYEWDVKTGKQTRLTPPLGVGESEQITVSHDQRWLVRNDPDVSADIADRTWRVELVDLVTGRQRNLDGLTRDDEPRCRFLPDGRLMASGKSGLRIYDPATGKTALAIPKSKEHEITVSEDGSVAIVTTPTGDGLQAVRWNLTTGRRTGAFMCMRTEWPRISRSVDRRGQISPDGGCWRSPQFIRGPPTFPSITRRCSTHTRVATSLGGRT